MLAVSMTPPVEHFPTMQKRPKLSLQTSELPITYGTSSRSLSTTATSTAAITPTTLNTFNNTYDLSHRPSPTSATASPSVLRTASQHERVSRSQSPHPKRVEQSYTVHLPYGIRPILRNTPFPRVRTNSISASPRSSTRRVFFPVPKKVVFKNLIEEEIVTKVYTACHSDLFHCNIEAGIQPSNESEIEDNTSIPITVAEKESSVTESPPKRRSCRRDSINLNTTIESSSEPLATPSSSKSKRRKWEWTLTSLPHSHPKSEADSTSKSESEHESGLEDDESESAQAKVVSPRACQDPSYLTAEACPDATTTTQPHSATQPALKEAYSTSASSSSPPITSSPSHKLSAPPLQLSQYASKRAGSLDGCLRKRKAECLDISTFTTAPNGVLAADADLEDTCGGQDHASIIGSKRRERAATL